MTEHYIKTAFRNFFRNKLFTLINLFGLATGMALSIMLFLYIYNEMTYDCFHENRNRIYLMELASESSAEGTGISAVATAGYGPAMLREFPEVENMVRFSSPEDGYLKAGQKNYNFTQIMYADSSVFDVFSFPLIRGDPATALKNPYSIVLTKSAAFKIFGEKDPVGEVLLFNSDHNVWVTGVAEDPPANSQIRFNALISFTSLYHMPDKYLGVDGGHNYYTYLLLHRDASIESLMERVPSFMEKHINYKYRDYGLLLSLRFEPLQKIHLFSGVSGDLMTGGDPQLIRTLTGIAFFILFIACINFINLSTARSMKRAKEIGLRKVAGATQKSIILQFLGESLLISIISLLLALAAVEIFQPVFNSLVNADLSLFDQKAVVILSGLIIITLLTGFVAGSFPAFYLSGFEPVHILKGVVHKVSGRPQLRKTLVFIQFLITSVLIVSFFTHFLQLRYLRGKDLGFDPDQVILIRLTSENAMKNAGPLIAELKKNPEVSGASASTGFPGPGITMNGYLPEGLENPIMIHALDVDCDYLELMKIDIVKGRNFSPLSGTDENAVLINETLARQLMWNDPVGKEIKRDGTFKVIGVVKDFHFAPLHYPVRPLLITAKPWNHYYYVSVKTMNKLSPDLPVKLEKSWQAVNPEEPFEYEYLSETIRDNYENVEKQSQAFMYFSLVAILLAGLGLFGQAVFNIEMRTREIGIRKVFGGDVSNILKVLSTDIIKTVIVANVISFPIAWFLNSNWLDNFAYRIPFPWFSVPFTLIFCILITLITIGIQTYRAAIMNPVDALRYE
ncbi:MAG: ABC transporter permease [Bacteroidales bacterium]|nr:ABC transporter permease [Bacteroidales bacterium]